MQEERVRYEQPQNILERKVNELDDALDALESQPKRNMALILKTKRKYQEALAHASYAGVNPKEVPTNELLAMARLYAGNDQVERKYKERIRSPLTGIRAMCVWCQGGSVPEVRTCPSTNCPLWPFRMGRNPFFNMPSADAETDEDYTEDGDQKEVVGTVESAPGKGRAGSKARKE